MKMSEVKSYTHTDAQNLTVVVHLLGPFNSPRGDGGRREHDRPRGGLYEGGRKSALG